jgi:hypothetical protein
MDTVDSFWEMAKNLTDLDTDADADADTGVTTLAQS